jgi:TonB-linked SusC/RagA family outer membrane protein
MRKTLLLGILMLCYVFVFAQTRTVTGRVTDEKGIAIPYATVTETGTSNAVQADAAGNFTIKIGAKSRITISSTGYLTQNLAVTGSSANVSMILGDNDLEEVVVTAQGIRRRPKELGYALAKVSNEDLTAGRSPQVAQGLSGKVSGLTVFNVNNSVDPAVKITLRGYRSMTGANEALIVLDGVPMIAGGQQTLSTINPNDIESITVLKGGQAATLYGSEGGNGALIITTKKGAKGKAKIAYNFSTNIEKINNLAQFQDKYGSGSHYATSFGGAGYKTNYLDRMKDNWRSYENQQFGDAYDGSIRPVGRVLQDSSVNMLPYSAIDGERERIWDIGHTTNHQVSLSGGAENNTFFLSLENNNTRGIVPGDKANRTGVRLNVSTQAGRLGAAVNLGYVNANYDRTTFDFYNETINQAAHIPLSSYRDWRNNKFANPNSYYNDYYSNPYFLLDNNRSKYGDNNINGSMELNFKVANWFNIVDRVAVLNNTRQRTSTTGQFYYSDYAKSKAKVPAAWDKGDGSGITRTAVDIPGSVLDNTSFENVLNNELQAHLSKNFGDFSTRGVLGFSTYNRRTRFVEVSSSSIVVPGIDNVSNRRGELGGGEENTDYRKFGYYGDLTVGWRDMVFLHGSLRYDLSSRFYKPGRDKELYTFLYPGVDLSVILTELVPSIKNDFLNYAKLRTAFNKNGNDNIGVGVNYGLDPTFSNAPGFPYGNTVGIAVGNTVTDAGLKPEFINSFEVGGEFQLLRNRINLDVSSYTQKSEGQVLEVKIPGTTGFPNLRINVGDTKNWGYEIDLRGMIIKSKTGFTWDMGVRYSFNDNKVLKLYQGVPEFSYGAFSYAAPYVITGMSYPQLKAISYVRDTATGRIMVSQTTGYPLTTGPLKNFGRTIPKYILGAGTKFGFKGISLSTNWEYRGGNVVYSDLGRQMTFTGSGKWTEDRAPHIIANSAYRDAVTGKVVENTSVMTREAEYGLWADVHRLIAENFVVPGWFIKMRDINLSYTLPANIMSKTRIFSGATIGIYGRNLVTIIDKANLYTDPEYSFTTGNGQGVSTTTQTPPVKQYGLTLNLNLK